MTYKAVAWSHSRVAAFIRCAFMMFMMNFAKPKVAFIDTVFTIEGKKVHKMFEERTRDQKGFPPEYAYLEPIAARIDAMPGTRHVETKLALNRKLKACGYMDFDDAWIRVVIDILVLNGSEAWAGDYKTGKVSIDKFQLMLTAAVLFHVFPKLQTVTSLYIWTKTGKMDEENAEIYERKNLNDMWRQLLDRYKPLRVAHQTGVWEPSPSNYNCGYCEVNKAGRCPHAAVKPKGK